MEQATICEMSPRDGLQFLGVAKGDPPRLVPLETKVALVESLFRAGLAYIEIGAFVSPKVTPQMADTDALCSRLTSVWGENASKSPARTAQLAALVPNLKHYERFAATRLHTAAVFVSASEAYAQANTRASVEDLMTWAGEVSAAAKRDGRRVRAHVSAVFQDIASGARDSDAALVIRLCERLIAMGCECVALADTNGETHPGRVGEVLDAIRRAVGLERIGVHLHDRNGAGLANAYAAWQAGVRCFDASVGGIGGSVKAAGLQSGEGAKHRTIAGNIATEELVDMFERMGVETGVSAAALQTAGEIIYGATRYTGDFAPPGKLLRERLGFGVTWSQSP